ncbi:MAG: hypothetical protein ACOX60_10345 [Massiliimalia sp.]|jgi:adenylate kinase family enzyme
MKLYITGSVASGKSTLARQISAKTGIVCTHLDEVVYKKAPENPQGDVKRPPEERDRLFEQVLAQSDFIMEDAGRECFLRGMEQADQIILLEIPLWIRNKRIVWRWMKQNLGLEDCLYKPDWVMLKAMLEWAKNYDRGIDGTKRRVAQYSDKVIVLKNNREIRRYLWEQYPR